MKDGFEMGNVWYNEPKTLDTAFDVMGDIILSAASPKCHSNKRIIASTTSDCI